MFTFIDLHEMEMGGILQYFNIPLPPGDSRVIHRKLPRPERLSLYEGCVCMAN